MTYMRSCCCEGVTFCTFPDGSGRRGSGKTGTCCYIEPLGNCCVQGVTYIYPNPPSTRGKYFQRIDCIKEVTQDICNSYNITGQQKATWSRYDDPSGWESLYPFQPSDEECSEKRCCCTPPPPPQNITMNVFWLMVTYTDSYRVISSGGGPLCDECLIIFEVKYTQTRYESISTGLDSEVPGIMIAINDYISRNSSPTKSFTLGSKSYLYYDATTNTFPPAPCIEVGESFKFTTAGWKCCGGSCPQDTYPPSGPEWTPCNRCGDSFPLCDDRYASWREYSITSKIYPSYVRNSSCSNPFTDNTTNTTIIDTIPITSNTALTTTGGSNYTQTKRHLCDCVSNITDCECANKNPRSWGVGRDFITGWSGKTGGDWFWTESDNCDSTIMLGGGFFGAHRCMGACCVSKPGIPSPQNPYPGWVGMFCVDNTTQCECDQFTEYDSFGRATIFGQFKGLGTICDGVGCVVPDCNAIPYDIVYIVTWVEETRSSPCSSSHTILTTMGNVFSGGIEFQVGPDPVQAQQIEAQLINEKIIFESQSSSITQNLLCGTETITTTYHWDEVGRISVPYCGTFVRGGEFQAIIPPTFQIWEWGNGDYDCWNESSSSISVPRHNTLYKSNPNVDPNPICECPVIDETVLPIPDTMGTFCQGNQDNPCSC